jgi:hypothetical protein
VHNIQEIPQMSRLSAFFGMALVPVAVLGRAATRAFAPVMFLAASAALLPASVASARQHHLWTTNPDAPHLWCFPPVTATDTPEAPDGHPNPTSRVIEFNVPLVAGVHEGFDIELVGVKGSHEFPAGTTDPFAAFCQEFPTAHCAVRFDAIVIGNDCDGDGVYMPGPGNPPCWGDPSASLEAVLAEGEPPYPKDLRRSMACNPAPKFRIRVSGPPILNSGIVGIKVRGQNKRLFLGASAYSVPNQVASGHAWVRLHSDRTSTYEAWGKYPRPDAQGRNQPFAPGMIRDDRGNTPRHTAWFPVTVAEWNAAVAVLRANFPPNPCSDFNIFTANCTHFMREVMQAAGCPIPDPSMIGINGTLVSPLAFNLRCELLLQTSPFLDRCGYIVANALGGEGGAAGGLDASVAYQLLLANPQWLAAQMGFQFDEIDAGACALRPNTPLALSVGGESDVLLAIDYGDGTTAVGGAGVHTHSYAFPGSYELTVTALVQGEVRRYGVLVTVVNKAANGTQHEIAIEDATEPKFPPVDDQPAPPSFIRVCPGDVDSSLMTDGADLAIVLAEWGSVSVTMADINEDGIVDASDLAIVLADWGVCDPG